MYFNPKYRLHVIMVGFVVNYQRTDYSVHNIAVSTIITYIIIIVEMGKM